MEPSDSVLALGSKDKVQREVRGSREVGSPSYGV